MSWLVCFNFSQQVRVTFARLLSHLFPFIYSSNFCSPEIPIFLVTAVSWLRVLLWLVCFLTIHLQIPPSSSAARSAAQGTGPWCILCLLHWDFQLLPGKGSGYTSSELMAVEGKFKARRDASRSEKVVINARVGDPSAGSRLYSLI